MSDDIESATDEIKETESVTNTETDWKAISRRWERKSKQNWSDLQDARAEIESLKAAVSQNDNLATIKADYEALKKNHEAMQAAVKAGIDWEILGDSKEFTDKLASADDIPALVAEFGERDRFKAAPPTAITAKSTDVDPSQHALSILLGQE